MTDTPTTIRLPAATRQALADEASRRGMKPATLAVHFIEQGLGKQQRADGIRELLHAADNALYGGGGASKACVLLLQAVALTAGVDLAE